VAKALLLGCKSNVITHQKQCFYFSLPFDIDIKQKHSSNKDPIKMHTER